MRPRLLYNPSERDVAGPRPAGSVTGQSRGAPTCHHASASSAIPALAGPPDVEWRAQPRPTTTETSREHDQALLGPQFGVGYEIPVGTGLSLTPQLEVVAAGLGDLQFNGETLGSGSLQLVKLGIGLTWH